MSDDVRPAGETAEQRARTAVEDCLDYPPVQIDAALDAYRDAVAAEARAALLRDAPVVWVAHEEDGMPWICERKEDDTRTFDGEFIMAEQWLVELLGVPSGTVRRYALVPHPEGEPT